MHEPGSRETAVVLAGTLALVVDGSRHELPAGDSVTFDADLPASLRERRRGADPVHRRDRRRPEGARRNAMPKNMFDKIWEAHEVSDGLIYIDLHLVHEVTSPQAFDGLRLADRPVRRADKTLATADHNTPTDGTMAARLIADQLSRVQVETLERNCEEFGIPIYSLGSDRQGIVHVIGPELGVTQPGMTIVCGDSHTSTHGAFGALAFGIGTSEVEHVLATQCLVQKRPKTMRITYSGELGAGVTPKDLILATIGRLGTGGMTGHAVEYAGPAIEALSMPGRMTICNMTIEGGGRAGMIAPDETTFEWVARPRGAPRPTSTPRSPAGASCRPTTARASTPRSRSTPPAISPMVTWGTNPGHGRRGHRLGPRPGRDGVRRPTAKRPSARSPTWAWRRARR